MGRNLNVPKHIGTGEGERIETTVLKRRQRIERVHADKVKRGLAQQRAAGKRKELRKQVFRNARDFVNNFKRREAEKRELARRYRQQVRKPVKTSKTMEGSMALVIRVKGDDIPEASRRLLRRWRLERMYEGAFVTVNQESLGQLQLLKNFVRWGYPTAQQVDVLLRTRGYTLNDNGQRVPIGGNLLIEQRLGEHNILCIEDMEHAISNHTEHFQRVVDFLAPFRFEPPEKGDHSEVDRRARERNTTAGEGTFASYLLRLMPELPQPRLEPKKTKKPGRKQREAALAAKRAAAGGEPPKKKQRTESPKVAAKPAKKAAPKKAAAKKAAKKVIKK